MFLVVLLVLTFLLGVQSQVPFRGSCPHQDVVQNFDVNRYTGVWYENRKYFAIFQLGGACTTATYSLQPDTGVVKVVNSQTIAGFQTNITGTATVTDPSKNEAKLSVSFFGREQETSNYWVLDTDYTSYAVVWACDNRLGSIFKFNTQFMWILTRERFPSTSTLAKAEEVVKTRELDWSRLSITAQNEDCPTPPQPETA